MGSHLLRDFQPTAIFEVSGDARRAKGVAANLRFDSRRKRSPANHSPDIGLEQGITGKLAGSALGGRKSDPLRSSAIPAAAMYSSR